MVLHRSNFEIPARLIFQPYSAEWRFVTAETVEWVKEPTRLMAAMRADDEAEKNWLRIRIEVPNMNDYSGMLAAMGLRDYPSYSAEVNRTSIPPNVLQALENCNDTPDISGRTFQVLICQKPEFKDMDWTPNPGTVTKNAWIMRDEFLNLGMRSELGWDSSVRQFLNKWGMWGFGQFLVKGFDPNSSPAIGSPLHSAKGRTEKLGFVMVIPHLLKEQQERYRKSLLPVNARTWLRSHPPQLDLLEKDEEFSIFRLRRRYCTDAINDTITIDHLAGIKHGICRRCRRLFEKETNHKKNYCSERCFNAAGVQRWRKKQQKKGAKHNAKS